MICWARLSCRMPAVPRPEGSITVPFRTLVHAQRGGSFTLWKPSAEDGAQQLLFRRQRGLTLGVTLLTSRPAGPFGADVDDALSRPGG